MSDCANKVSQSVSQSVRLSRRNRVIFVIKAP